METSATTHPTIDAAERARTAFDAINKREWNRAPEFWGPETVDHFLPVGVFQGTEAIRRYFEEMTAAVPDFKLDVQNIVADGATSVVQWRVTGTFDSAPFMGIEPTGKRIDMPGVDVIDWNDDGTIKHNTIYYDGAEFARQIGMLPPRDSSADRAMMTMFNGATKLRKRLRAGR
jgi:steroid delta-isomerase-like uncharacterized protein